MTIRTVRSADGTHRWRLRVTETRRGISAATCDDSMGPWSDWRAVFCYASRTPHDAMVALADFVRAHPDDIAKIRRGL